MKIILATLIWAGGYGWSAYPTGMTFETMQACRDYQKGKDNYHVCIDLNAK